MAKLFFGNDKVYFGVEVDDDPTDGGRLQL
jgi:hypothetical protein